MRFAVIILILLWQSCCCSASLNAADADLLWTRAVELAKVGQADGAFVNFHMLVQAYPDFSRTASAQFDLGEYFFFQNNFEQAAAEFKNTYAKYPKSKESLVALAYLYKMAK